MYKPKDKKKKGKIPERFVDLSKLQIKKSVLEKKKKVKVKF